MPTAWRLKTGGPKVVHPRSQGVKIFIPKERDFENLGMSIATIFWIIISGIRRDFDSYNGCKNYIILYNYYIINIILYYIINIILYNY